MNKMPLPTINRPSIQRPKMPTHPQNTIAKRMDSRTRPAMIMAAPGKYVPAGTEVPEMTLCRWERCGDGYAPVPVLERWVRLDSDLIRLLGFNSCHRSRSDTMLRLSRAGFIEIILVAPKCHLINLDSWFNHLRRCAEDPFFWEDAERIAEYRRSI
jgi:hypothetical protein